VVIIRDKPHLKLCTLLFDDDDDDDGDDDDDDMHLTLSSNSSTLDMPPHIVTVNAAAARSTASSVIPFSSPYPFPSFSTCPQTPIHHLSTTVSSKFSS
jgi:hypothetical protein